MSRVVNQDGYVVPPNPEYLEFKTSDGSASRWPPASAITRVVDSEGSVNYFEHLPLEHAQNIKWRYEVGDALARASKMPVGPNYMLKDFPDGYRFYNHYKGLVAKPRQDLYLFGHKKRFRTPREFIFHAIWLMGDMKGTCDCPYCSKRPQKEVTADLEAKGIILPPASHSGTQRLKSIRENRTDGSSRHRTRVHDTRTYAAVRPVPKPLKPKPGTLKQAMLVDRDNDLRAIYSKTSMELRRWFREGEVIWCVLSTPISTPENAISIQYWPAVIEQVKLKSIPVPQPVAGNPGVGSAPQPELQAKISQPRSSSNEFDPSEEDSIGPRLETSNEPVPWSIRQSTRYEVQLLAVSRSHTIDDEYVLPYAAHIPSEELINFMLAFDQNKLVFEKETLLRFNPCSGDTISIYDAIPAYAMALQIASTLSSYWCLTDEYDVKYSVSATPPTSPKPARIPLPSRLPSTSQLPSSQPLPPPQVPITGTLESTINQAGEANGQSHTVTTQSYHKDIHTVDPSMSQSEAQRTSQRILGFQPPPSHVVQKRFQGFWWGTERIWVDDFIRLKVPRRTLAPTGTDHILAPSGPGKTLLQRLLDSPHADNLSEFGAGSRGVFLRLDGIFAVDVPTEDGQTKKEARVCGMLYELAEEDWEDPKATANRLEPTSGPQDGAPIASPSQGTSSSSTGTVSVAGVEGFILPSRVNNKDPYYLLPQAPIGFKFRPILVSGYEFIGAMGLISGRYYPRILSHPVLKPTVEAALLQPREEGGVISSDNLWALEGLSGGYFNSMDPVRYKKSRLAMMQDADLDALARLRDYAEQKRMESKAATTADAAMDVDIDDIYA